MIDIQRCLFVVALAPLAFSGCGNSAPSGGTGVGGTTDTVGAGGTTSPEGGETSAGGTASTGLTTASGGSNITTTVLAADAAAVNGGGTWRPFSDDSSWNTPIPPNPELEPDSAALIEDFRTSSPYGAHLDVNIDDSIPIYWADAATPTYQVSSEFCNGDGWTSPTGGSCTGTMPIPTGATQADSNDADLLVINREQRTEWGCWNMSFDGSQWRGGVCARTDLSGTGVRTPQPLAAHWYDAIGPRACGFPLVAGLIRTEEIAAGRINHALVLAYPHIRAGWFTPPASTSQSANGAGAISTRGIPCGGRIQLDPAVDVDALGLSQGGRAVMKALQEYGAYVGDAGGALSLCADGSPDAKAYWATGVLGMYDLLDKLDFSRLRVLKIGTLYDGGNG